MAAGAFGFGEAHQGPGTLQRAMQLLREARDRIAFRPGHQRGAADLFRAPPEAVVAGDPEVIGEGIEAMHPEGPLEGPVQGWIGADLALQGFEIGGGDLGQAFAHGRRERQVRPQRLEEIPLAGVGDAGRKPVLPAGCTGRQIAAETPADQRHPLRVHLRAGERVVDHRAHHVLPVGAEHQALVDEGSALAGAVEGEAVVAAAHGGHGMGKVRLVHGGVVAVGGDHQGARLARVIGTVEVAGQARALVGDFHGLHGGRHAGGGSGERLGLPVEGLHQPDVHRRTEQRQVGRAVVVAGPQVALAGAH